MRLAQLVGQAVVITQLALGHIIPVQLAEGDIALGMHGVVDAVVLPIGIADAEQADDLLGVVDKGVGQPVTGLEAHRVTRLQPIEHTIEPDIRRPFQHVDKLVLGLFGMGPAGAMAGFDNLVVDANAAKAEVFAEGAAAGKGLLTAGVVARRLLLQLAPVFDAGVAIHSGSFSMRMQSREGSS